MRPPVERARIIHESLKCFAYGWWSFVPIIGIGMCVVALLSFQKAKIQSAGEWNPASRYLNWGIILACTGCFISAVSFAVLIWAIIKDLE